MLKTKLEDESEANRKECPHVAKVTFNIEVKRINHDGSMSNYSLGEKELEKYGVTNKAIIHITGPTESICVNNLKERLEKLNG